jgi:NAD(P)-dependent dehydrogenase (short-subunit alcohol dehydrogenase family)
VNSYRLPAATGPVEHLAIEEYVEAVNINLTEAFFACQQAAAQMIAEGVRGTIVNVTSVGGVLALPHQAAFCSSMAALSAVTKVLATEWAHHGIRVAAVAAGLSRELAACSRTLVSPEDVANAVRLILTEEARAIAGVPLYVDGGWLSDGYWEPFP